MIVVQTLYKMKKKRGMFMENEQSVVLTNWKRNYLFFLSGQFLSGITSMVVQYAIIWYLTRETGSATILSFATLLGMIPMVLLSPFVGPLVDRWDKKALLLVTNHLCDVQCNLVGSFFGRLVNVCRNFLETCQYRSLESVLRSVVPGGYSIQSNLRTKVRFHV